MLAVAVAALAGALAGAPCTERSVKLTLIEQLPRSPQILILGSSRARQAEPAYVRRITGRTGFNGAVGAGTAADAWVTTRHTAARFPGRERRYIWFVDVGIATNGVSPALEADPRARRYLSAPCPERARYLADGSLVRPALGSGPGLASAVRTLVAGIRANPPTGGRVDPRRYVYFERTIAFMNARGERPVIVLNPIHPEVLAELRRHDFPGRKVALAYLARLQERLDFVVVDGQDVRRWGGTAVDWSNATHVSRRNMRRLLQYVVARSDGALD